MVHPLDRRDAHAAWRKAARDGAMEADYRILDARTGAYRWFRSIAEPGVDSAIWEGWSMDVDNLYAFRDAEVSASAQHRVKNILAVVRSVALRSMESAADLDAFVEHFDGRLQALGRTHALLALNPFGAVDLELMVRDELPPHADVQADIGGPHIGLRNQAAESLSLAVHELAVNALKYGALSTPNGRLRVGWRVLSGAAGRSLRFDWRESGVPVIDTAPAKHGFGRGLIEMGLAYDIGAQSSLRFSPGGLTCRIDLKCGDDIEIVRA